METREIFSNHSTLIEILAALCAHFIFHVRSASEVSLNRVTRSGASRSSGSAPAFPAIPLVYVPFNRDDRACVVRRRSAGCGVSISGTRGLPVSSRALSRNVTFAAASNVCEETIASLIRAISRHNIENSNASPYRYSAFPTCGCDATRFQIFAKGAKLALSAFSLGELPDTCTRIRAYMRVRSRTASCT